MFHTHAGSCQGVGQRLGRSKAYDGVLCYLSIRDTDVTMTMVHLEGGRALAACNVPQPCGVVARAGRQCLPVDAECNTIDPIGMTLEKTPLGLGFA